MTKGKGQKMLSIICIPVRRSLTEAANEPSTVKLGNNELHVTGNHGRPHQWARLGTCPVQEFDICEIYGRKWLI